MKHLDSKLQELRQAEVDQRGWSHHVEDMKDLRCSPALHHLQEVELHELEERLSHPHSHSQGEVQIWNHLAVGQMEEVHVLTGLVLMATM